LLLVYNCFRLLYLIYMYQFCLSLSECFINFCTSQKKNNSFSTSVSNEFPNINLFCI
jgi:hypothetical protein